jgi:hypothetical protein
MSNTENAVMQFVEAMTPYLRKIIQEETRNAVRTAPATVISADNDAHTAVVKQIYSDAEMSLRNCTGKILEENDSVIIMWFGSQTNAWIGIKNDGLPWNING